MTKLFRDAALRPAAFSLILLAAGCAESPSGPAAPPPGPGPAMGGPGPGRGRSSPIGQIMHKVGDRTNGLTGKIGQELKQDPPPWDALQPQAHEYAELAAALAKLEPSRGSAESWAKQTAAYSEAAQMLDKAAAAKDRDATVAAHATLEGSCMACHREHRSMGRGPRGGGPPPGFGGPVGPGGPPPDAPNGPPPGGPDRPPQ